MMHQLGVALGQGQNAYGIALESSIMNTRNSISQIHHNHKNTMRTAQRKHRHHQNY